MSLDLSSLCETAKSPENIWNPVVLPCHSTSHPKSSLSLQLSHLQTPSPASSLWFDQACLDILRIWMWTSMRNLSMRRLWSVGLWSWSSLLRALDEMVGGDLVLSRYRWISQHDWCQLQSHFGDLPSVPTQCRWLRRVSRASLWSNTSVSRLL